MRIFLKLWEGIIVFRIYQKNKTSDSDNLDFSSVRDQNPSFELNIKNHMTTIITFPDPDMGCRHTISSHFESDSKDCMIEYSDYSGSVLQKILEFVNKSFSIRFSKQEYSPNPARYSLIIEVEYNRRTPHKGGLISQSFYGADRDYTFWVDEHSVDIDTFIRSIYDIFINNYFINQRNTSIFY